MPLAPPLRSTRARAVDNSPTVGYQRRCTMARAQRVSAARAILVSWGAASTMVWGAIVAQRTILFSRSIP
eukprot:3082-Lingulodinium_polyedra.AAC.1